MRYEHTYNDAQWVYTTIKEYFCIEEFFDKPMCRRYPESLLWSMLSFPMLSNMLYIRRTRGISITVNNWLWGGPYSQRGFRSILSYLVVAKALKKQLYASAHVTGEGVDFNEKGVPARTTRKWIIDNAQDMPFPCRLEGTVNGVPASWTHLDTYMILGHDRVEVFNV